jgi:hypothetical protein
MNKATVIIPTTGTSQLETAINSVIMQDENTSCYVVVDGIQYKEAADKIVEKYLDKISYCVLPENVGSDGFYGHRIYASFPLLINTEYVLFLDQDNWLAPNHVSSCIKTIEDNKLDWCYSLRNIFDSNGFYVCPDNCESLGHWPAFYDSNFHLVDTNCYCLKTAIAIQICHAFFGKWGADRVFFSALRKYFPNFKTTGKYTAQYMLGGNTNGTTADFFLNGNKIVYNIYKELPWN